MRAALSLFIGALTMFSLVGGVPVALAGPAKQAELKLEDQGKAESGNRYSRRPPCDQVIAHIDHHAKAGNANPAVVAKEMDANALWVERCMQSYGRRISEEVHKNAEGKEQILESFEEDEPEEVSSEDVGGPDVEKRSERQRLLPHPERERVLRQDARPIPGADQGR